VDEPGLINVQMPNDTARDPRPSHERVSPRQPDEATPSEHLTAEQALEIASLRERQVHTRRSVAPKLEEILHLTWPVLDHGFIRVVDYMGDDAAIVQAARVSYGRGTKKTSNDQGLINYLMRNRHSTPFEMCEIKLHVKLPIFVARQWIRHRTANVNEYSARYSILDSRFYMPDKDYLKFQKIVREIESLQEQGQADLFGNFQEPAQPRHLAAQSKINKQGRDEAVERTEAQEAFDTIASACKHAYRAYEKLLNEDAHGNIKDPDRKGIARELARMVLPMNIYTEWYWKIDLHNLLHFIGLRADPHAQYEIRAYAEALLDIVRHWVPLTYAAFLDYRLEGVHLSAKAFDVVRRKLRAAEGEEDEVTQENSGLTPREWRELQALLAQD
jgi:thymidylate synthase (FAD)